MNDDYSIGGDFNGADDYVPRAIDEFAQKWIGQHYMWAFGLLLVAGIFLVWYFATKGETFNPTQTMIHQTSDQFGLSGHENMTANPSASNVSAFSQQVQDQSKSFAYDPRAAANQQGSLAWQVLNSSDFNCSSRVLAPTDAWAWMNGVAHSPSSPAESFVATDNGLSQIMNGH